jgi:hypothetical protein
MKSIYPIVLFFAVCLSLNCTKTSPPISKLTKPIADPNPNAQSSASDIQFSVSIDPTRPGFAIPNDFSGMSFEAHDLGETEYLAAQNTVLINLIKNLGQGYIRVGGNSVDNTQWTNGPRSNNTPPNSMTTTDIDRFFAFAAATGWKVLFGLNLSTGTPSEAASEASYLYRIGANQLADLEIGNEPDLYSEFGQRPSSYTYSDFQQEFQSYVSAIKAIVPSASFSGPTTAGNIYEWLIPFAQNEYNTVNLITQHFYQMGPPNNASVTVDSLLSVNNPHLANLAKSIYSASEAHNLGYRISECNSVYNGGKDGVSNVFASALWAVDLMFTLAEQGCGGVNFHGGANAIYTPIADSSLNLIPRPLYYGMLYFSTASKGSVLPVATTSNASINLTVHAVLGSNNSVNLSLINKDETKDAFVNITTGSTLSTASILRLTASSLYATSGVSFGGSEVNPNGTWSSVAEENAAITSTGGCTVRVPAGSAVLVTMH